MVQLFDLSFNIDKYEITPYPITNTKILNENNSVSNAESWSTTIKRIVAVIPIYIKYLNGKW